MANCSCNISSRLLSPGVFNLKQFLNSSEVMRWTVSSRYIAGSNVDLSTFGAFLVLQNGSGEPDEVALTSTLNNDNSITITWDVGSYATWLTGYVKYQIVFRGSCLQELNVLAANSSDAHNGVYEIDNETSEGNYRTWTHKTNTTYKITWDSTNSRWQLKNGNTLVSYQTFAHSDPCCGTWNNVVVGNVTACVWESLEAVMYISESIAADEHVSAKCPTILRQMWTGLRNLIIKSGVSVQDFTVASDSLSWTGNAAPYSISTNSIVTLATGCKIENVEVYKNSAGTITRVDNVGISIVSASGNTPEYFVIQTLEKFNAIIRLTIKGGNGYYVSAEGEVGTSRLYVAYASDDDGTGFSLTPSQSLKWRAEFVSFENIQTPTLQDFTDANAVWVKYIGNDGDGEGGDISYQTVS